MTPEPETTAESSTTRDSNPITAPVIGAVMLALGLVIGYVLFGQKKTEAAPTVANTATATYAPDTASVVPVSLGRMGVRNLKTLDEWDPLDAFDGGFPLPPEDWTPPLLALNPPIPVAVRVETTEGTPGGPAYNPTAPPAIRGDLPNLPPMAPPSLGTEVVPLDPGAPNELPNGTQTLPGSPPTTSGSIYVGLTLGGVNEKTAQATISALASKYAGAARSFTHMGVEGDVEAEGVLLLVAPGDVDKAVADIRRLGAVTAEDRSEGTARSRQSRLSSIFASRLTTLRKRREELLIQFLEDADPIKTIDAAIDREARALGAVKISGAADRLAAIRILLKP